jgi:F-type H+-transporting ATPase subunit epsilon
MNTIDFQLVTPERTVLSKELVSLSCPTQMGQITILPNHIPLVANLAPGELHAKTETDEFFLYVAGGFVEVKPNNEVVVLADDAAHFNEIDVKQAEEAKARAEEGMKEQIMSEEEYAKVAATLQQSLAKLNVARRHAHHKGPVTISGTLNQ